MRTWTLAFSISAHAVIAVAIFVAPIFADADLPDPRRALTFEAITPIATPTIPVTPRPQPAQASKVIQAFPVAEPPELPPDDSLIDLPPPRIDFCESCGVVNAPIGNGATGQDLVAPPPAKQVPKDPIPVGGNIRPPARVVYAAPVYPQLALAARVQGTVILQAVIDEKGNVSGLTVLRGHPLLDDAAMQAVSKWQFTPTLLNGTTVPVLMTVTVSFTLTK